MTSAPVASLLLVSGLAGCGHRFLVRVSVVCGRGADDRNRWSGVEAHTDWGDGYGIVAFAGDRPTGLAARGEGSVVRSLVASAGGGAVREHRRAAT